MVYRDGITSGITCWSGCSLCAVSLSSLQCKRAVEERLRQEVVPEDSSVWGWHLGSQPFRGFSVLPAAPSLGEPSPAQVDHLFITKLRRKKGTHFRKCGRNGTLDTARFLLSLHPLWRRRMDWPGESCSGCVCEGKLHWGVYLRKLKVRMKILNMWSNALFNFFCLFL